MKVASKALSCKKKTFLTGFSIISFYYQKCNIPKDSSI